MKFFQKNKTLIVILLMVSFLLAILLIFISGVADSNSRANPTESLLSQQSTLVTSTNNLPVSTPQSVGTQAQGTTLKTATPTASSPQEAGAPPSTQQSSATEVSPLGTDAAPPATFETLATGAVPPGTNVPPPATSENFGTQAATNVPRPPTFQSLPTEAPPAGNGNPPGS
jgi:cytoskeletal protein RodZ